MHVFLYMITLRLVAQKVFVEKNVIPPGNAN